MPDIHALAIASHTDGTTIAYWLLFTDDHRYEWWSRGDNPKRLFGCSRGSAEAAIGAIEQYFTADAWSVVVSTDSETFFD